MAEPLDLDYLQALLAQLRASGVTEFACGDLHLSIAPLRAQDAKPRALSATEKEEQYEAELLGVPGFGGA